MVEALLGWKNSLIWSCIAQFNQMSSIQESDGPTVPAESILESVSTK
jgi:hypothetical protein